MSQPTTTTNTSNGGLGKGIIKILILAMMVVGIIGLPVAMYEIGTLIAIHLATGDIETGYAYGGLMYVIYNTTHVQQYYELSQQLPAMGTTEGIQDISTIQTALLVFGLFLDGVLAYITYLIYKHLEDY